MVKFFVGFPRLGTGPSGKVLELVRMIEIACLDVMVVMVVRVDLFKRTLLDLFRERGPNFFSCMKETFLFRFVNTLFPFCL